MRISLLIKKLVLVLFFIGFLINPVQAEEISPLGFQFGMSNKSAKKLAESKGLTVISNEVDSKKVRTIQINGSIVDKPIPHSANEKVRMEFFDDKLMSISLTLDSLDYDDFKVLEDQFLSHLIANHGEPNETERMLSYELWSWHLDQVKLLMSSDNRKSMMKLEYSYVPILKSKIDKELSDKRKGKDLEKDPASKMFKDGNYSKPQYSPF